jgi:hypothetical protein
VTGLKFSKSLAIALEGIGSHFIVQKVYEQLGALLIRGWQIPGAGNAYIIA